MGMDLIPNNDIQGFSANWNGWEVLTDLLDECGADTRTVSFVNDGDRVTAQTATDWAEALDRHLSIMYLVKYADPDFIDGFGEKIQIGQNGNPPAPSKTSEGDPPPIPLIDSERDYSWVTGFSQWLRDSGGFQQF